MLFTGLHLTLQIKHTATRLKLSRRQRALNNKSLSPENDRKLVLKTGLYC